MSTLTLSALSARAGDHPLVHQVSLSLRAGELVALLGANGAGKSSLLRAALAIIPPSAGDATVDDVPIRTLSPTQRARHITYLPQQRQLAWPIHVEDAVALGRFAYGASPGRLHGADARAVSTALRDCDLAHLARRRTDTLSGGELARVHCARAFAAATPLLLADEPVAALDPRHQCTVMNLIRAFVQDGGGALVVLHDVTLAARYADRLLWMRDGEIVADGPPADTLSSERLRDVYGVDARVTPTDDGPLVSIRGVAAR